MATLTHVKDLFVFRCSFAEREIPKRAAFRWDAETKTWYSYDLAAAMRLREYADSAAKSFLNRHCLQVSPWEHALPLPPEGLALLPHQTEAVQFALARNHCYLGLDPGLGKTPVAAMIARALGKRIVYICPPFLLYNVMSEFRRWGAEDLIYIFPDSLLIREDTQDIIRRLAHGAWSYTIVIDEAHRFKNPESKRTQALFGKGRVDGLVQHFERQIYMSGTPMPNRPIELFPVLSKAAPETIDHMDYFKYGLRFCAGRRTDYGWDFSGASNMAELNERVIHPKGPFMLRMKKELLNLPPKIEEVFVVSADMSPRLAQMDKGLGEQYGDVEDLIKHQLAKADGREDGAELHTATYRRLLGVEKVKATADYVKYILDESDESVIVFAYHKDVIAGLVDELKAHIPLVIDGTTKIEDRHARVKQFQESTAHRLVIANYVAGGIGFTMTKATRVLMAEFSWVPGENDQAGDRAHRIGQTKSVLVQYVVYKDSLDKAVVETLLRKRKALQYV